MINKLEQLKENFAKYNQYHRRLVSLDGCSLCAEGVLAITVGGTIANVPMHNNIKMILLDGGYYYSTIPGSVYQQLNLPNPIPKTLLLTHQKQLKLTKFQIVSINKEFDSFFWHDINDYINLTFSQFSLLLDLLNEQ